MATKSREASRPTSSKRRTASKSRTGRKANPAPGNPLLRAAVAGGAVAAGMFLWSRRNEVADRLEDMSTQVGDWRQRIGLTGETSPTESGRSQADIAAEALTLKQIGQNT